MKCYVVLHWVWSLAGYGIRVTKRGRYSTSGGHIGVRKRSSSRELSVRTQEQAQLVLPILSVVTWPMAKPPCQHAEEELRVPSIPVQTSPLRVMVSS